MEIEDLVKKGNKDLYQRCIDKWGIGLQMNMLIEECSELITAVSRIMRGRNKVLNNLIEEIADVELLLGQIKHVYNIEELVLIEKDRKIERLEKRLKKEV